MQTKGFPASHCTDSHQMRALRTRITVRTACMVQGLAFRPGHAAMYMATSARRGPTALDFSQLLAYSENVLRNLATLGPATAMQ